MADSAYLYSDDRPDAWDEPDEGCFCDSRWTLPLAWFFFFEPEDVRLIDVESEGSQWQEVRLSAEKKSALELFELRKPLLMSMIDRRIQGDEVARFVTTVGGWTGRYLLMNPNSVLSGINGDFEDDRGHARRIAQILKDLGDGTCPADMAHEITGPYVKDLPPDPVEYKGQILGYTCEIKRLDEEELPADRDRRERQFLDDLCWVTYVKEPVPDPDQSEGV